ncbi:MAG: Fe-S cluster assembly protein SufD [Caulobacter sp.]|nr:Fe-S cluster assembly protein SufD [Caulobacter sp.]
MTLASAIATGDLAQLPSRRDEDWRWTDLRGLIRALPPASPQGRAWLWENPLSGQLDMTVGTVNGRGHTDLDVAAGDERFVGWRFMSATPGTSNQAELWVDVAAGAKLTLIESYEGRGAGYLTDVAVNIKIADGGSMERIIFAEDDAEGISVSTADVTLAPGASFAQTILTSGARRQRIETRVTHPGQGASVRLDGVYLLRDQRHADLTTVVTHGGLEGTTTQLTKGVVRDQARGVFQGRIVVERGADQTDARMGHHALILSDRAEVDAKPELLIFADDVQCAHGNTIGALDESAIFYARQRGMPQAVARAMLTEAFVGEVVDRIEHEGARDVARAWVSAQLGTAT